MRKSKTIDYRIPMDVWVVAPELVKPKKPTAPKFFGLGT